ncbi:MAG: metallophosphoesterase [Bacteroidales bacterium]|nr:metallophosphoesterase [Bacteroidales bacterium]
MKIQYASDLHLEFEQNGRYIEQGGIKSVADVLVLAGDVSYLGDRKMWKRPFWDWCAENFQETFVVLGNHEFYSGFDIGRTWPQKFPLKVLSGHCTICYGGLMSRVLIKQGRRDTESPC